MDNKLTIGEKLKARRNELGWTLKKLSEESKISMQLISDYENNRKEPGLKNLQILCSSLDLSPGYLLDERLYSFTKGKEKTVGQALSNYLNALQISNTDEVIIEDKDVFIKINNEYIKNSLIMCKKLFQDIPKDSCYFDTFKTFLTNISGNIDIDAEYLDKKIK